MSFSSADARRFLMDAFSDDEIETWCFDHFPEAYKDFGAGMSKSEKIQQMLEYVQGHDLLSQFFSALQAARPEQFQRAFGPIPPPEELKRLFSPPSSGEEAAVSIPALASLTEQRIANLNQSVRYFRAYSTGLVAAGGGVVAFAMLPMVPGAALKSMLVVGGIFVCSLSALLLREISSRKEKIDTCQSLKSYLNALQKQGTLDRATRQHIDQVLWQTFETAIK